MATKSGEYCTTLQMVKINDKELNQVLKWFLKQSGCDGQMDYTQIEDEKI